jgi:hypothetical protein
MGWLAFLETPDAPIVIDELREHGIEVFLLPEGILMYKGKKENVSQWLPVAKTYKESIIDYLSKKVTG